MNNKDFAHQYLIKKKIEEFEKKRCLFPDFYKNIDLRLKNADIKEIDYNCSKSIILKYEWLKSMPAFQLKHYGIFFNGCCGGVVIFSPEYSEAWGVWDKYGFTKKIILLSRGASTYWAPKNTASKLIMGAIKKLPERFKVISATVDSDAGEIGTITPFKKCFGKCFPVVPIRWQFAFNSNWMTMTYWRINNAAFIHQSTCNSISDLETFFFVSGIGNCQIDFFQWNIPN